jgi:hypothetical protein
VTTRFNKHYTRAQARALLPQLRQWLDQLDQHRSELSSLDQQLAALLAPGQDVGGPAANRWVHLIADIQAVLCEFASREIQVKDLDRGLVDFPSFRGDREIFLCWERTEDDIEYWHELDSGFAGREPL